MNTPQNTPIEAAMKLALLAAEKFRGATAPNPPVGAAGLDIAGNILGVAAHERAGEAHAEVNLLRALADANSLSQLHTVVVTLEPCNHTGRTGPCTHALLHAGVKRVVYGAPDPNPHVAGGGAEFLRRAGVEVTEGVLRAECEELIRGFTSRVLRGRPWITVKRALRRDGSMIPPMGEKTFTSPAALRFAHELRRQSDAILTGSGTVLADNPLFSVRHVSDHAEKRRDLILLDRRARVSDEWKSAAMARGLNVVTADDLPSAIEAAMNSGALELLVEAGPELSNAVLASDLWDERIDIHEGDDFRADRVLRAKGAH